MSTIAAAPARGKERQKRRSKMAYFNRELSWLSFNRRVLGQAASDRNPLLERLKFLSIVSSNLDEFFEIRVAGLIQQVESGVIDVGIDGLGPREQLRRIHDVVRSLVDDQYRCWQNTLIPALSERDIFFLTMDQLKKGERSWLQQYFREQVMPVLTPLAVDPAHPFPQIVNKTLNVLVSLDNPETEEVDAHMAILPVPRILPRVVRIDPDNSTSHRFIFLSELIKVFAGLLFPGYRIHSAHAFRITRNSDLYIDEEEAENLLEKIEEEIQKRQKGAAVRLEVETGVEESHLNQLLRHINLPQEYVFRIDGPLNLMRLMSVYQAINRPDLKDKPFTPLNRLPLPEGHSIFDRIARQDHLLHHPFDSFHPIVEFVRQAAHDPDVFAIKQTLYRTSGDSPIINALIEASRNGKQVTALVELKARFDEANNIQWAKQLEEAGVHVVYGMVGHKIHCKCCLVVRREGGRLRHYVHLGTGNYNPTTARLYTDLSFFTARESITAEVALLFNTLTGFGRAPRFRMLHVAPFNLHPNMQSLIRRETRNAKKGCPARIKIKMNNLVDQETIDHLYEASQAGVKIDLWVRGICCLVPGIRDLSENITVKSIVGRFLEHSRIFYFENHGKEPVLLAGSADWMPRNFYRRVEVVFPIEAPSLRSRILDEILATYEKDTEDCRLLRANGAYGKPPVESGEAPFSAQRAFIEQAAQHSASAPLLPGTS